MHLSVLRYRDLQVGNAETGAAADAAFCRDGDGGPVAQPGEAASGSRSRPSCCSALPIVSGPAMRLPEPPLLVISDRTRRAGRSNEVAEAAFAGGCRWFSLREKDMPAGGAPRPARGWSARPSALARP